MTINSTLKLIAYIFPLVEPSTRNGSKRLNRNNSRTTKPHELDSQGLVPLPAKTCFKCRKSCKKAPLIACDYCPLLFHQDCLDPPLTAPPTGMWMCPNHVEQFIDWNLVNSSSATERIKLWSRFSGPVDQDTVKAQFLRKIHHKNPPFRYKLKAKMRDRIEIPGMVEYHYKNPPRLLPSLKEVLRYDAVSRKVNYEVDPITCNVDLENIIDTDIKAFDNAERILDECENRISDPDEIKEEEEDDEQSSPISKRFKHDSTGDNETSINISDELKNLDESLIKLLALQRLQQILDEHPNIIKQLRNEDKKISIKEECDKYKPSKMVLPSQLLSKEDIARIALQFASPPKDGENIIIKDLIKPLASDEEENKENVVLGVGEAHQFFVPDVNVPKTEAEKIREFVLKMEKPILESNIRCRAVLTPIENIFHERFVY